MGNFKETKKKAWKYYKIWMKEDTFCPILNRKIRITRKGWNHLISGSRSRRRSIKDKRLRLLLLKPAKYIINNSKKTYITKKNGINYVVLEGETTKGRVKSNIRVLLKSDKKGNLYFYSAMKK